MSRRDWYAESDSRHDEHPMSLAAQQNIRATARGQEIWQSAEHYNLGVEAGLAMRVVDELLARDGLDPKLAPADAVRALARGLVRVAALLP